MFRLYPFLILLFLFIGNQGICAEVKGQIKLPPDWTPVVYISEIRSFEEFKEALGMIGIPCFNVVYADKDDNIYNLGNGLIPNNRKEGYNWHGILRGDTSDNVWKPEFYKFEELPQIENPSCGWICPTR